MSVRDAYDVAVVGGGPAGSTVAGFCARAGLRVALCEREPFPRFHVGESSLPAMLPLLDRLGVRETVARHGFQVKRGAYFHDQESGLAHTFYFQAGKPWPDYAYQVDRAEFDHLLLEHARKQGADVLQPATVTAVAVERDGVTVTGHADGGALRLRAQVLVDASGRDSLLASAAGHRERVPNLGKVGLFAHFRGAARWSGMDEGLLRIHIFRDGWFWWIPLAGDRTSVGCVLHARTVRARPGSLEALYEEMIGRCEPVARNLRGAERITPVHREANFAYENRPLVGDRVLAAGDAFAFVDPIFSSGVYIAMQSGELAARAVAAALAAGRADAGQFRGYERAVRRGVAPFFRMIHKYYEPAFLELFLRPRNRLGMVDAVLSVLTGGAFLAMPWRTKAPLELLFGLARLNVALRRRAGLPVESRLEW
jgi:flavin-dependent dehydrogenase